MVSRYARQHNTPQLLDSVSQHRTRGRLLQVLLYSVVMVLLHARIVRNKDWTIYEGRIVFAMWAGPAIVALVPPIFSVSYGPAGNVTHWPHPRSCCVSESSMPERLPMLLLLLLLLLLLYHVANR